ncbi:MAG: FHA domain-containing protein [Isosphaeraceae bacterium]
MGNPRVASLFVIRGADQGKRFDLGQPTVSLGREACNTVRLHDNEVSRRHAEIRRSPQGFRLVDLGSANGTFVNGDPVDQALIHPGDQVQIGQTVMLFSEGPGAEREMTRRVDLLSAVGRDDRSAIIKAIPAEDGSKVLKAPAEASGDWLRTRLANLGVMYQATQAISHIVDPDELLPRILQARRRVDRDRSRPSCSWATTTSSSPRRAGGDGRILGRSPANLEDHRRFREDPGPGRHHHGCPP